jgi:peroxiredoxin
MPAVSLEGVRPDGTEGVVGHFNPWASGLAPAPGTSLVVHFPGEEGADTDTLAKALGGAKGAVAAVVLLPPGRSAEPRELPETGVGLVVGEDVDGYWARSLGVTKTPATVVLDPGGQVALQEEGRLTASKLGRALGRHAREGARVMWQPLRLGVVAGDVVPEFPFRLGRGAELSLRRMRGSRVALTFWASWCEPSMEQLRQFARASRASEGGGPLVLAVGDGVSEAAASEVADAEGLPFEVIPDPDRTISSRFAVGVWPSTVWIGPDLRVEGVSLGLTAVGEGADDRHTGTVQAY